MKIEFVDLPYEAQLIPEGDLKLAKAIEFIKAVSTANFSQLIGCFKSESGDEFVVFETEPEVSQNPKFDIRYNERIAVHFEQLDVRTPWVYALRKDFPVVSHLNSMHFESPKCLCLYETPYEEIKLTWSSSKFLERIRDWLKLSATGDIHQGDQPLEPFMLNSLGNLILPEDFTEGEGQFVYCVNDANGPLNFRLFKEEQKHLNSQKHEFLIFNIELTPQVHGVIQKTPETLLDLQIILESLGCDLIEDHLKPKFKDFIDKKNFYNHKIIILLNIPFKRDKTASQTVLDRKAFITLRNLKEISTSIRLWFETEGIVGVRLPRERYIDNEIKDISIGTINVYDEFNKSDAALFNGVSEQESKRRIGIIGAGALGSQIVMILSRMGYGEWKIVDNDILLPHNLARHELNKHAIGLSKSESISAVSNDLLSDQNHSIAINDNYLNPKDQKVLHNHFEQTEIILDVSASVAVARKLAHDKDFRGRRISLFMNPKGTDLIMLAEPKDRSISIDCLEAQYYRSLQYDADLEGHLKNNDNEIRYSTSCRDISSRIGQDNVSIFAGIGAKSVRRMDSSCEGNISIWSIGNEENVRNYSYPLFRTTSWHSGSWRVILDQFIIDKINDARDIKLPNETGGILLGFHDQLYKTIYVVDSILSPLDSKEYPNAYYRGIDGLNEKLKSISDLTMNNLMYIGEWHSHPNGSDVLPSEDDKRLFNWIEKHLGELGLPPLMIISGDNEKLGVYTEII